MDPLRVVSVSCILAAAMLFKDACCDIADDLQLVKNPTETIQGLSSQFDRDSNNVSNTVATQTPTQAPWEGAFNATFGTESPADQLHKLSASKKAKLLGRPDKKALGCRTFGRHGGKGGKKISIFTCSSCKPGYGLSLIFHKKKLGRCRKYKTGPAIWCALSARSVAVLL